MATPVNEMAARINARPTDQSTNLLRSRLRLSGMLPGIPDQQIFYFVAG
jgi:hypothetical protein